MSVECSTIVWKRNFSGASRKVVAVKLADHADDEGRGIWPSVERIAAQCDISCRTVQRVLSDFVKEGILRVVSEGGMGPGSTRRYDFNMAVVRSLPLAVAPPDAGSKEQNKGDTVSPLEKPKGDTDGAKGDTDDIKGCHGVTQTVIEPPIEPSEERVRERDARDDDRSSVPGTAEFRKRLQRFLSGDGYREGEWPKWAKATTIDYISKHFAALAEVDRRAAESARDAFLGKCGRDGGQVMGAGNYFRDHAWEALSARDWAVHSELSAARAGTPRRPDNFAKAYGPIHAAMLFRILCGGPERPAPSADGGLWLAYTLRTSWPRLAAFWQQTAQHGGMVAGEADLQLGRMMEFVPSDSDLMVSWRDELRRKGLPDVRLVDGMDGLYFPAGGPDHLHEFERAINDHAA